MTALPALSQQDRIALVLTGGGARGLSQIGALRVIERAGLRPDVIIGCSFGSVVGALYAAGHTADEIDSIMRTIDWDDIISLRSDAEREYMFLSQKQESDQNLLKLRFNNFVLQPPTAIGGSARFSMLLQQILWKSPYGHVTTFDDLRIPLRVVTTNLANGRPAVLQRGNLALAVRASATFPLRYSPVRWNADSILVDGGLVANIPTDIARSLGATKVIVVNTVSPLERPESLTTALSIADQALMSSMKLLDSVRLADADVVITPQLGGRTTFDFEEVDSLVILGMRAAELQLDAIKALSLKQNGQKSPTPWPRIQVIAIDGDSMLAEHVRADVDIETSYPSTDVRDREIRTRVLRSLRSRGYQHAFVRSMSSEGSQMAITIDLGTQVSTTLRLNNDVSTSEIQRELAYSPDDSLSLARLMRTWQNLHASDLLNEIDVRTEPHPERGTQVTIAARSQGNQSVGLGIRVDNERYTQGSLQLTQESFFVPGLRLMARGAISERIGTLSLGMEMPRIAGSLWTATLRAYTSFRNVWIYTNRPDR
ncbi:MAG: patatin-like phospholipase family protein, partial [Bacteroidota bacterium]